MKMEYSKYYENKKSEKCIHFRNMQSFCYNNKSCDGQFINSIFDNDEYTRLNIFTIIKNEIINVLSVIKKYEYNKNLDSSIIDSLFILYNSINNLNTSLKEEIDTQNFNNKLDIYHIAPFLNIIRNNSIFYKIKVASLHSLDHILKYSSSYFNEKCYDEGSSSKHNFYIPIDNKQEAKTNSNNDNNKNDSNASSENNSAKPNDKKDETANANQLDKINEKNQKKKKYIFFPKNYRLYKRFHFKKEESSEILINKGNNIINISIETLLNAPINYNNVSHEEIILYDTMVLFNNILNNTIKVVDRKNIIKIICYIFKIYKSNKYSLLFKANCEALLKNILYIVINNVIVTNTIEPHLMNHHSQEHPISDAHTLDNHTGENNIVCYSINSTDDNFIHDILTIILILINNNKNKFVADLIKTSECVNLYNDIYENENSQESLESINILAFRLLNIVLETCGYLLINKNFDALSNIIRCLFFHITSSSFILMCKSMRTYINIFILYKKHFCIYNEIFINILLKLLKSNALKNVSETTLLTLSNFFVENVLFEIYCNHDVNLYASNLLENLIQSILDLSANFTQNTTIMNEAIFKIIKNILQILKPYTGINDNNTNNNSGSNYLIENANKSSTKLLNNSNNRLNELDYTNQLITQFRNDIYSNAFDYVIMNSQKKKKKKKEKERNTKNNTENKNDAEKTPIENSKQTDTYANANNDNCEQKKEKHTNNVENTERSEKNVNENKNVSTNDSVTNDNNKNSFREGEGYKKHSSEENELKKSNMNELYFLNFLTSSKDKSYINFCSVLLFEYLKECIKIDYIKNKDNFLRKKKERKEILQKSATIFNTLKNKSIDELIKMRILQTHDTINEVNQNNSKILNSGIIDKNGNLIDYSTESDKNPQNSDNQVSSEKEHTETAETPSHVNSTGNDNAENAEKDNDGSNDNKVASQMDGASKETEENGGTQPQEENESGDRQTDVEQINKDSEDNNISNDKKEDIANKETSEHTNKNIEEGKISEEKKGDNMNNGLSNEENNNNSNNDASKSNPNCEESQNSKKNDTHNSNSHCQQNLMEDKYFLKSLAMFLRYNPFLDKEFVGEYISHRKYINVLKHYVRLFDFCNLSLLSSLRLFLYCFKLPGEAQLIERILEHFSLCLFYSNPICEDLDKVYKLSNGKVICLLKEEELANIKRYILIDYLSESGYTNNTVNDTERCNDSQNTTKNNSECISNENTEQSHNIVTSKTIASEFSEFEEKIDFKKNEDRDDNVHRNVYYMSKKIQSMSEEEIKKKYVIVENSDVIFILTYSIIMLNTDLHNNQVKNKMKLEEFIKNNRGINNGKNIDRIYLENLYNCILHEEIKLFSNAQNIYTNDNQYWKLLEQRKEYYKNYHPYKEKSAHIYKYDINKLLIKNNFIPIFFEIFKRTSNINLIENCLGIFKTLINNLSYYHDVENINKLCYIFKYINFYLTQKTQSLIYLLFHFIKKTYNILRDGWIIYINSILKLITIDLVPTFFYPHLYINNTQFNSDKESLNVKYKRGNSIETYNINKTITEIYHHPFLVFKKNVKKLNKPKWIDEFSSIFFSRHNNNENNKLLVMFKENNAEKTEDDKKKKKKNEKKNQENTNNGKNTSPNDQSSKQIEEENEGDDENNDEDDHDNMDYIYVHVKPDPKSGDNSTNNNNNNNKNNNNNSNNAIIDNINIYKRLKLDIYNFFTVNDFYSNMVTNLNINSFVYLLKILIIKSSIDTDSEHINNLNTMNSKTELHHSSIKSQVQNQVYLTNENNKGHGVNTPCDNINDTNAILVNSDNSFNVFYCNKKKLLTSQMFFHIMYFKINYTYILYDMIVKEDFNYLKYKNEKSRNYFLKETTNDEIDQANTSLYHYSLKHECKENNDINPQNDHIEDQEVQQNKYDITLDNIYDTDNCSDASSAISDISDISSDSIVTKKKTKMIDMQCINSNNAKDNLNLPKKNEKDNLKGDSKFEEIFTCAYDEEEDEEKEEDHEESNEESDQDSESDDSSNNEDCNEKDSKIDSDHEQANKNKFASFKKIDESINKHSHSKNKMVNKKNSITNYNNIYNINNRNEEKEKEFIIGNIKRNIFMKTYIMHLKAIVLAFEQFFNLLNKFLSINYNNTVFVNVYNRIFNDFPIENVKILSEEEVLKDNCCNIYDDDFENISKKYNYNEQNLNINDIEASLFLVKNANPDDSNTNEKEEDWLYIEQLIMSIMNFSYICLYVYQHNKTKKNKFLKKLKMASNNGNDIFFSKYAEMKRKNNKFFFLCGIYLIYILQFLKKNILYRFIDKIIYILEKISKNVYVNSCIINIYLHMLQLITPNNILYKNTNNTNISLTDKDIYIYIEKATVYTESINNIINNNAVLLKLNNFNIENIVLSLLPYLLYFNSKKEEINAHISSINSECLHIISNIYYKSVYMYMNSSKKSLKTSQAILDSGSANNENITFEQIIELKKLYIFLLTCFVLSLACSFSSKRTRSEAYIKLQEFLFNENYIFKNVNKDEQSKTGKHDKHQKHDKYFYRDEKLIDLINNFIILPLITYNYYFPFICKNLCDDKTKDNNDQCDMKDKNSASDEVNNYCKKALLNFNLHHKRSIDIHDSTYEENGYEKCGCIINYKNIENIDNNSNEFNNIYNYANDYYIHTMLHKQYNYYFSYLYAKKMLTYDNVCYRKSMSISFVSHIILSFLYSLLNSSEEGKSDDSSIKNKEDNLKNDDNQIGDEKNNDDKTTKNYYSNLSDEGKIINKEDNSVKLYELLCVNNESPSNKIVTQTKCGSKCIYYFLKHFYHTLLTIKEETQKILNIYKETFIENIKNIIYVSSSYAYNLKDERINCFSHIKNGLHFLSDEEKKHLNPCNIPTDDINDSNNDNANENKIPELDNDIVANISKLQINVRISMIIVYHILYDDNNQNDVFNDIFEELLNVLLTKYAIISNPLDENEADHHEKEAIDDAQEDKNEQNDLLNTKEKEQPETKNDGELKTNEEEKPQEESKPVENS
ncbi:protein transport protein SEC7, putative [Plasmodium chabaudi adami]|uniref:Protein transport protein SEC7, putative n=1 Tax=Plasmodium chabaudi adami TaxID=5826 RepID=A0A1D3LL47_PLACE|nr:protein transport protein SEC7, putative [Plasmodium chabaudi adami]